MQARERTARGLAFCHHARFAFSYHVRSYFKHATLLDFFYTEAFLRANYYDARLVGETFPLDHKANRMEVVEAFLRNGIPLAKIEGLRQLLERNAFSLTSCKHMAE